MKSSQILQRELDNAHKLNKELHEQILQLTREIQQTIGGKKIFTPGVKVVKTINPTYWKLHHPKADPLINSKKALSEDGLTFSRCSLLFSGHPTGILSGAIGFLVPQMFPMPWTQSKKLVKS